MKPVNKTAALSLYGGHHYKSQKKILTADSYLPIKTRKILRWERMNGRIDLTGMRVGRFTVIGVSAESTKKWVVRCRCGIYTERTQKAILNKNNQNDMCELCRDHEYIKSGGLK